MHSTRLQPPVGPFMDLLCPVGFSMTKVSYRFSVLQTFATAVWGTFGILCEENVNNAILFKVILPCQIPQCVLTFSLWDLCDLLLWNYMPCLFISARACYSRSPPTQVFPVSIGFWKPKSMSKKNPTTNLMDIRKNGTNRMDRNNWHTYACEGCVRQG